MNSIGLQHGVMWQLTHCIQRYQIQHSIMLRSEVKGREAMLTVHSLPFPHPLPAHIHKTTLIVGSMHLSFSLNSYSSYISSSSSPLLLLEQNAIQTVIPVTAKKEIRSTLIPVN